MIEGEDNLGLRYLAALSLAPGTKPTSFNQVMMMSVVMMVMTIIMMIMMVMMMMMIWH